MNLGLILLCCISLTNAASISRSKRQYVVAPLYSACSEYLSCAAPAVCMSGTCQCTKAYQPYGATCISASPEVAPVAAHNGIYHVPAGVAPSTFRTVYTDVAQPVRMMNAQPQVVYYQQVVRAPQVICAAAPCPEQALPTPPPQATTYSPDQTTSAVRMYDGPSIAYPGEQCQDETIVCVGGSFCVSGTCVCRDGEIIQNRQCVVVTTPTASTTTTPVPATDVITAQSTTTTEIPTTTTPTTTTTTTTTPQPTTTTTPEPTTTTTTTTTVAPTTTVPTTTELITEAPTTTTSTTTQVPQTVPSYGTTQTLPTTIIGRDDQGCNTPNCNCNNNNGGCLPQQVIRINFVMPGQSCVNNSQCRSGSYCSSGTCACASSFEQRGTNCIRRRK